jgi:hypothetical protein
MVEHAMTVFYERIPSAKRTQDELEWITSTTFRSPVSSYFEF